MLEDPRRHRKLAIVYQPTSELTARSNNPRTHSIRSRLSKSQMRYAGSDSPTPSWWTMTTASSPATAGSKPPRASACRRCQPCACRISARPRSGLTSSPTISLPKTPAGIARCLVWSCSTSELDIDLDVTVTGFELPEIDLLIGELTGGDNDPADAVIAVSASPPVTRPGDVWRIGGHRLTCGDSTSTATYQALLGEERAQLVFTDPPYNVPISGHVGGLGAIQHREFAMASGEMSSAEFTAFLQSVFSHLATFSTDGSIHFQCMDWRHVGEMLAAGTAAYTDLKNICVWAKNNAGMGSLYRSQHEFVFVFKSGTAPHINNVELGKYGRYRSNVWNYAGVNGFGENRDDLSLHPTVKPVAMVADAIRDCSHRKGIVLDAFVGSGTTLIAAERTGRRGYGIEIDPAYCDVTIRRLREVCGLDAVLQATGQRFAEVEGERAAAEDALQEAAPGAVGVHLTREPLRP